MILWIDEGISIQTFPRTGTVSSSSSLPSVTFHFTMDPEKTTKAPSTRSVSDDNNPVYNEVHVDPVFGQTKRGLSGELHIFS